MGVLSALPLIAVGNLCCCLWVVAGGLVAAYLLQQNYTLPITAGDGAIVGLLAGLIGAVIHIAISIPLDLLLGPMERAMALRFVQSLPPDMREMFESVLNRSAAASGAAFVLRHLGGLVLWAFAGAIFGTLGGVIGASVFRKTAPPPGTIDVPPAE
jgi:hypothetical protein